LSLGSNLSVALITALISGAIDWGSKTYVLFGLGMREGDALSIISGILTFVMSWNHGINFGLFANDGDTTRFILSGLAIIVSLGVLIWIARLPKFDRLASIAAGLIVGGALGNAYDRIIYGAVADFLNVTCCGINNPFAFNIADIAIFLGVVVLAIRDPGKKTA